MNLSRRNSFSFLCTQIFWVAALVCFVVLTPQHSYAVEFFAGYGTGTYGLSQTGELGVINGSLVTPNSAYMRLLAGRNNKDYWYGFDFSHSDMILTSAEQTRKISSVRMLNTGLQFGGMHYYIGTRYKTHLIRYEANSLINLDGYDVLSFMGGLRIVPLKTRSLVIMMGMELSGAAMATGSEGLTKLDEVSGYGVSGWGETRIIFGRRREGNFNIGARVELGHESLSFTVDDDDVSGTVNQTVETTKFYIIFGSSWL